jgi:putative flippase GtrA
MPVRSVLWQWLRFVAVGVSNTVLSWCVYATLEALGVPYLLASAIAFAVGALNSYVLNRRWTFHSRGRPAPEVSASASCSASASGSTSGCSPS